MIMNEHLMEALRRLRQSSTETNVDRRLVNNVLLSYLSTPRGDPKRFEMLSLLSSILSWTDDERERAGLQRKGGPAPAPAMSAMAGFFSRGSPTRTRNLELEKTDETEVSVMFRDPFAPLTFSGSPSLGYGLSSSSRKQRRARRAARRARHHP